MRFYLVECLPRDLSLAVAVSGEIKETHDVNPEVCDELHMHFWWRIDKRYVRAHSRRRTWICGRIRIIRTWCGENERQVQQRKQ